MKSLHVQSCNFEHFYEVKKIILCVEELKKKSRPLFTIIFKLKLLILDTCSNLTGSTKVEFLIYCVDAPAGRQTVIYKSKQILNVMNIMNDVDFANYFTIQILQCIFSVNDCQFSQFSALFDRFVPCTQYLPLCL